MRIARLFRAAIVTAALMLPSLAIAQPSPDPQGLVRERDANRERLMEQDNVRKQRELQEREQAERAARQRLESRRIERIPAPSILLPGAPPTQNNGVMQPGVTNRGARISRDEAARRDQLEYERARRELDDAAQPSGSTIGLPGPWKPTGAK